MAVQPTVVSYPGDGSTTIFTFQFDYLDAAYVKVRVNGVDVPFTFNAEKIIEVATPPAVGQTLVIARETERERLVDFVDGSVLIEDDLDLSSIQLLNIVQEAIDLAGTTLGLAADGSLQASGRRIGTLGDPVDAQDAVTKNWAETSMNSDVAQAAASAAAALASEGAAAASESAAATSETNAGTSETNAAASEAAADADRIAAAASAAAAATSEGNAATSATNAATSETNAATSAAAAAADAASIDPAGLVLRDGDEDVGGFTAKYENYAVVSSGSITPDPLLGNMKGLTNGGAFTFNAPTYTGNYTIVVSILNNASAGAVTFSGFNTVTGGLSTTNGDKFFVYITKIGSNVAALIQGLQ